MGNTIAMINVTSNINIVIQAKLDQIKALAGNPDPVLRTVAMAVLPEVKHRVHVDGLDSTGAQIGTYTPEYMVVRTGAYKNADRKTKGINKGDLKNSGKHTKGLNVRVYGTIVVDTNKAGTNRPAYNRSNDTKVVLSLTRQMENDFTVVQSDTGYGLGYLNPDNYQKALWCEETYKKPILTQLTKEETELATNTAIEFVPEYIKSFE